MYFEIGAHRAVAKIIKKPIQLEKRWGQEDTYINSNYCMKTLTIKANNKGSMHFHIEKHETLLVVQGTLLLRIKDPSTTEEQEYLVQPLEAVVVPPGFLHQLCALSTDVLLVEASTFDNNLDSIRVHM